MSTYEKTESRFFQRVMNIGASKEFSITELRYLRVTNMASVLGVLYNGIWMIAAMYLTDIPVIYGSNALLAFLFLGVLVFNHNGWRVLASIWLSMTAYVSVILFLYLLGYSSGVAVVCFLLIIIPYMTFPQKARKLAHGFGILACLTLLVAVLFQFDINARYDAVDPFFLQVMNFSITGLISLALLWSMSVLIDRSETSLIAEQKKSDDLLHNILPVNVAKDLKETGQTIPQKHSNVTILFTDFKDFTELVASISEITLVNELNDIFGRFDDIVDEVGVEKIETIGDAYLAVCGLGPDSTDHAMKCINAAQRMLDYLDERNRKHTITWRMRVGIHSGPIVAGVVGKKKFRYDLFGDTINTASRTESAGKAGRINISATTYELVKGILDCEYRGEIHAKGKGEMAMYFVK